jgi:hypothetical protein
MKYSCNFIHPITGEQRTVIADVSDAELEMAAVGTDPQLYCEAFALARAYPQVAGFAHSERPKKLS